MSKDSKTQEPAKAPGPDTRPAEGTETHDAQGRAYVGDLSYKLTVEELNPTPTPHLEGFTRRRAQLADGQFYPVVKSERHADGKVYHSVARGRFIEASVMNSNGVVERKKVFIPVIHCQQHRSLEGFGPTTPARVPLSEQELAELDKA